MMRLLHLLEEVSCIFGIFLSNSIILMQTALGSSCGCHYYVDSTGSLAELRLISIPNDGGQSLIARGPYLVDDAFLLLVGHALLSKAVVLSTTIL
mmetsp:Transcript_20118/g.30883  ORF Transcript_20118/g.30883 Transcript_20118/m.30883 type:complete len:95 (+) Transcript_20118:147-431(+)